MKRMFAFICILVLSLGCISSAFASSSKDFTPTTASSFVDRSTLDWYQDYGVELCIYMLHDTGLLSDFLISGNPSHTLLVQDDLLLSAIIDLGDRVVNFYCCPLLDYGSYSISVGEIDDYIFQLMTLAIPGMISSEGQYKTLSEEDWASALPEALAHLGLTSR